MLNIVIPMAGKGSRFSAVGYKEPKPLISVHGKPMIQVAIENLRPSCPHRFIFLCLAEQIDKFSLSKKLEVFAPNSVIIPVETVTEGAACTLLLAKTYINNADPLMIANCDQWVDVNMDTYLHQMTATDADGLIMTLKSSDPKWSFVALDQAQKVVRVAEKEVISNEATVGIYNFKHGADFVSGAEEMISKELRINGEFYVAPVYNELVKKQKSIITYNIGSEFNGMYGIGIPSDLEHFLKLPISARVKEC